MGEGGLDWRKHVDARTGPVNPLLSRAKGDALFSEFESRATGLGESASASSAFFPPGLDSGVTTDDPPEGKKRLNLDI